MCSIFQAKGNFPQALSKLDNLKTEADAISSPFSNTFQWYITANCFHPCNALAFNISLKSMWDWKKETNISGAIFHFLVAFYHKNLSVLCLAQGDTSNLESTLIFWCFVPSKLKLSHFCKSSENCFDFKIIHKTYTCGIGKRKMLNFTFSWTDVVNIGTFFAFPSNEKYEKDS